MDYNLQPIWNASLNIYREVKRICDRHNLRVYLAWGSVLGAYRHKGFIPWDDDLDLHMPRGDYERFKEYATKELPPHLKLVNWQNTPEMDAAYGKLIDIREDNLKGIEDACGYTLFSGVNIDIFPIDGFPPNLLARMIWLAQYHAVEFAGYFQESGFTSHSPMEFLGRLIGGVLCGLCPSLRSPLTRRQKLDSIIRRYDFDSSRWTGSSSSCPTFPARWPKSIWEPVRFIPFEGELMPVPNDPDLYLTPIYGNWHRLPPADKQTPTHGRGKRAPWYLGPTNQ